MNHTRATMTITASTASTAPSGLLSVVVSRSIFGAAPELSSPGPDMALCLFDGAWSSTIVLSWRLESAE